MYLECLHIESGGFSPLLLYGYSYKYNSFNVVISLDYTIDCQNARQYIVNLQLLIAGLASLSESELQEMHSEMKEKFSKLSEVLIEELQHRDMMASQLDTKNNFIAALLRVQTLKHTSSVATADPVKSLRSRARSLSSSMRQTSEEKSSGKVGI